eukprot:759164-Hanusia_phi.AAC.3
MIWKSRASLVLKTTQCTDIALANSTSRDPRVLLNHFVYLQMMRTASILVAMSAFSLAYCQSIDPERAERFFNEGHALHSKANSHADAAAFEGK